MTNSDFPWRYSDKPVNVVRSVLFLGRHADHHLADCMELAKPFNYRSHAAEWNGILEGHGMWASSPMNLKGGVA